MLRMPPPVHAELARAAEQEQISLNQYITNALTAAMERADGAPAHGVPRWLSAALRVAIVVTVAAAILAIVLLVLVWANGW
jgi:type IV secretory pathway component VirB8